MGEGKCFLLISHVSWYPACLRCLFFGLSQMRQHKNLSNGHGRREEAMYFLLFFFPTLYFTLPSLPPPSLPPSLPLFSSWFHPFRTRKEQARWMKKIGTCNKPEFRLLLSLSLPLLLGDCSSICFLMVFLRSLMSKQQIELRATREPFSYNLFR